MRVTRAFVGSVGAGLCLVAAAVTVLFVLSAVVAVRGWPGVDPENDVPRVTLADASRALDAAAAASVAGSAAGDLSPIVLPAPTTTDGDGDGGDDSDADADGDGDGPGPGGSSPQRPGAGGTPTPGGGTTASGTSGSTAPSGPGQSSPPTAPAGPARPVAEAIREAGRGVAGTSDSVAPGSGSAITEVTDTVADGVDQPEQRVRDTSPSVEETTGAVAGLLGG